MNATFEVPEPVTRLRMGRPAKRKILLVDDDPAIHQILRRLLAEEDVLVLTAANGAEALELANAAKFDLALLDLNMPVEDGGEIVGQLSAQNPLLPVILITDCPDQLFHAVALGVRALLEKPLDFTKLFRTIHNLLTEPAKERLTRFMGRPAVFHYIPSKEDATKKPGG